MKSTPRFSPLVARKKTDKTNVTTEMTAAARRQLINGMSRLNLKNSIVNSLLADYCYFLDFFELAALRLFLALVFALLLAFLALDSL